MSSPTIFFKNKSVLAVLTVLGGTLLSGAANAATANFDSASSTLHIQAVDVPASASRATTFDATLALVGTGPYQFELTNHTVVAQPAGDRVHFDPAVNKVFVPTVTVDNGNDEFFAEMELVPGSNPLRFTVTKLHSTGFTGCPGFSQPVGGNACLLSGSITQDVTLSNEILWVLQGGVDIGGDNTQPATLTIEPNTRIIGQSGADFLFISRGSKINAVGTPQHPIIFTGPGDDDSGTLTPGAWGGVVIAGNAPVNGCSAEVAVCVQFDEALTRPYGGNDANENSGILKYAQIRFAGNQIRPDQELNALTLLGVGAGTTIDFVQLHRGSDDGIEMFGGTVNFKHVVNTGNSDDNIDWGQGWRGKAQFVLIQQIEDDGDNGIEADNNEVDFNSLPRSKPVLANITAIGTGNPGIGGDGALLRRGTGANIHNSVFTGFRRSCLNIDSDATFQNAGTPGNLTGELTIVNTFVDCPINFNEEAGDLFRVSDWFNLQAGNQAADSQLNGFLPAPGSPLLSAGAPVADSFFEPTNYSGAFADENDNWTKGWTFGLN